MFTSRRGFLRSLGAGCATSIAVQWPLTPISRASTFEPSRLEKDNSLIRLNSNENAYGPSTRVANAIKSSIGSANRYPRMEYASLAERIASLHEVKPEEVVLGCGSTEILRMAAFAFLGSGKQLIQASPMLARAGASTTLVYIRNPNNPTASLTPRKDLEAFI